MFWPLYLGGTLVAGSLLSALIFRRERTLRRLSESVSSAHGSSLSGDRTSVRSLLGVVLAFAITQLPVEETRIKLLRLGSLEHWGSLLGLFDLDQ